VAEAAGVIDMFAIADIERSTDQATKFEVKAGDERIGVGVLLAIRVDLMLVLALKKFP
jgi:hypothetical protein